MTDQVDYTITALTLWREGRGESGAAKRGIYWVIRNRMADPRWPSTAYDVVLQPKQFSCYNAGDKNATLFPARKNIADWLAWQECRDIVNDPGDDPTGAANHYHTRAVKPAWHKEAKVTVQIGSHVFLKL